MATTPNNLHKILMNLGKGVDLPLKSSHQYVGGRRPLRKAARKLLRAALRQANRRAERLAFEDEGIPSDSE